MLLVELVERNLNWLLERAPEMPAPERTAVPAADTGTSAKAQRKDSRMEETFCLTGDLSGQRVDDDSPIYILAETGTYEASLRRGNTAVYGVSSAECAGAATKSSISVGR